ncbi:hypothetical protein D3C84_935570 [compost metagenome]
MQQVLQGRQRRHVQQRHGAHLDYHHLHFRVEAAQHAEGLLRRAEEQRPANGIGQHLLGQLAQGLVEVLWQGGGVSEVAHALDEEASGQQQADAHRQHHVEQDRQHQAHQQHHHVVARRDAQGVGHMSRFAHVPGHHQQQCGQRGHRQVAE